MMMAQPIEKWIEELEKEVNVINEQLSERAIEIQRTDPVMNEFFRKLAEKQGALNYLKSKSSSEDEEKKPNKTKSKKK